MRVSASGRAPIDIAYIIVVSTGTCRDKFVSFAALLESREYVCAAVLRARREVEAQIPGERTRALLAYDLAIARFHEVQELIQHFKKEGFVNIDAERTS